ncbi:MAG: CoA transferase [Candidatus Rokuibacteriota bacterium]
MDQALSDVTVLDLGQVIAMPFCTMLLADLGARVIKVESPERGRERVSLGVKRRRDGVEERVPAAQYRDRNKLGVTLDLKTPAGAELFRELVKRAAEALGDARPGPLPRAHARRAQRGDSRRPAGPLARGPRALARRRRDLSRRRE